VGLVDGEVNDLGGQTPEEVQTEQLLIPMTQVMPRSQLLELSGSLRAELRAQADLWSGSATHDECFLFNKLQALLKALTLSEAEIEDWNRGVLSLMNSTEFRSTLDLGIMSPKENDLTRRLPQGEGPARLRVRPPRQLDRRRRRAHSQGRKEHRRPHL
jgi:hypothetical protein